MSFNRDKDSYLRGKLWAGEKLLWAGQPDARAAALSTGTRSLLAVGIFLAPVAFRVAFGWSDAEFFWRSHVPLPVAMGQICLFLLALAPPIAAIAVFLWTLSLVYAVTDQRLIMLGPRKLRYFLPAEIGKVAIKRRRGRGGDVLFSEEWVASENGPRRIRKGFRHLRDAEPVFGLVRDWHEWHKSGKDPNGFPCIPDSAPEGMASDRVMETGTAPFAWLSLVVALVAVTLSLVSLFLDTRGVTTLLLTGMLLGLLAVGGGLSAGTRVVLAAVAVVPHLVVFAAGSGGQGVVVLNGLTPLASTRAWFWFLSGAGMAGLLTMVAFMGWRRTTELLGLPPGKAEWRPLGAGTLFFRTLAVAAGAAVFLTAGLSFIGLANDFDLVERDSAERWRLRHMLYGDIAVLQPGEIKGLAVHRRTGWWFFPPTNERIEIKLVDGRAFKADVRGVDSTERVSRLSATMGLAPGVVHAGRGATVPPVEALPSGAAERWTGIYEAFDPVDPNVRRQVIFVVVQGRLTGSEKLLWEDGHVEVRVFRSVLLRAGDTATVSYSEKITVPGKPGKPAGTSRPQFEPEGSMERAVLTGDTLMLGPIAYERMKEAGR